MYFLQDFKVEVNLESFRTTMKKKYQLENLWLWMAYVDSGLKISRSSIID